MNHDEFWIHRNSSAIHRNSPKRPYRIHRDSSRAYTGILVNRDEFWWIAMNPVHSDESCWIQALPPQLFLASACWIAMNFRFNTIHRKHKKMNRDESNIQHDSSFVLLWALRESRYSILKWDRYARICSFWASIGPKSCIVLNFKSTDRACVSRSIFFQSLLHFVE